MRRMVCILLAIALLLPLCACYDTAADSWQRYDLNTADAHQIQSRLTIYVAEQG